MLKFANMYVVSKYYNDPRLSTDGKDDLFTAPVFGKVGWKGDPQAFHSLHTNKLTPRVTSPNRVYRA